MKSYLDKLILAGFLCLTAVACTSSGEDVRRAGQTSRRELARQDSAALKVATVPTMDCLPLFVAAHDSLFQKNGVDVRLRLCTNQMDGDTLLLGRHVEGVCTDLIRAERLRKKGLDLHYATATNACWQLISNRQARVSKVSQLADKMIAMTRYSATDYLATLAVDSARPKEAVFRVQINDVGIRLRMILNNEMDAALLPEPQATTARLKRHRVLADSRAQDIRLGVIAFGSRAMQGKQRRQQLERFLKAYNQACDSITRHGAGHYSAVIAKYMHTDKATIDSLPKLRFTHAESPRQKDIDRARRFWR